MTSLSQRLDPNPCHESQVRANWQQLPRVVGSLEDRIAALEGGGSIFPSGPIGMNWFGAEADIPAGWALMDGIANAVGLGGTGLDLIGSFVKYGSVVTEFVAASNTGNASPAVTITGNTGASSPGGTCSGTTASSSGTTGTASPTGTVSGTIGAASTGITVGNHTGLITDATDVDHSHVLNNSGTVQGGSGASVPTSPTYTVVGGTGGNLLHTHTMGNLSHSVTDPTHTHSMSSVSVTLSSHDHSIGSHTHTFTGTIAVDSHTHGVGTLAGTAASHGHTPGKPDHCIILPIERLNP